MFADIPYFLHSSTRYYDSLEFAGDKVFPAQTPYHPKGFKTVEEFLTNFAEALVKVTAKNAFALVYHSVQQEVPLMNSLSKAFEKAGRNLTMHTVYSFRQEPSSSTMAHCKTRYPINSIERALHLVIGDPNWADYGKEDDDTPIKWIPNCFLNPTVEQSSHPYHKPEEDYAKWIKYFSRSNHRVLEAFAGSCPSMMGAMRYGRNLTLVEKSTDFHSVFKKTWAVNREYFERKGLLDFVHSDPKGKRKISNEVVEPSDEEDKRGKIRKAEITKQVLPSDDESGSSYKDIESAGNEFSEEGESPERSPVPSPASSPVASPPLLASPVLEPAVAGPSQPAQPPTNVLGSVPEKPKQPVPKKKSGPKRKTAGSTLEELFKKKRK